MILEYAKVMFKILICFFLLVASYFYWKFVIADYYYTRARITFNECKVKNNKEYCFKSNKLFKKALSFNNETRYVQDYSKLLIHIGLKSHNKEILKLAYQINQIDLKKSWDKHNNLWNMFQIANIMGDKKHAVVLLKKALYYVPTSKIVRNTIHEIENKKLQN